MSRVKMSPVNFSENQKQNIRGGVRCCIDDNSTIKSEYNTFPEIFYPPILESPEISGGLIHVDENEAKLIEEKSQELMKQAQNDAVAQHARTIDMVVGMDEKDVSMPIVGSANIKIIIEKNKRIIYIIIIIVIICLFYILYLLDKPTLSGTWHNNNSMIYFDHNRLTDNISVFIYYKNNHFPNTPHSYYKGYIEKGSEKRKVMIYVPSIKKYICMGTWNGKGSFIFSQDNSFIGNSANKCTRVV